MRWRAAWAFLSLLDCFVIVSVVTCVRQVAGDSRLPYPLDSATDYSFTGFGVGECALMGPLNVLPAVRYLPAEDVRRIAEPGGVMIPTSSYTIGGRTCTLTPGAELYLDDVQPPTQLNVTDVTAFSQSLERLSKDEALSYIKVLQSSNPEGGANCDPPAGRGGKILIRNTIHFEVLDERNIWSPNRQIVIRLYPNVRYVTFYVSVLGQAEGLTLCIFRTVVSGGTIAPSTGSASPGTQLINEAKGLGNVGIVVIVAALLVCLVTVGTLVGLRKRIWRIPAPPPSEECEEEFGESPMS